MLSWFTGDETMMGNYFVESVQQKEGAESEGSSKEVVGYREVVVGPCLFGREEGGRIVP
ncbi:hypothetical protein HKBW3C_02626 [Candidatus Hakubella thermalkaliphila]|uniref:Uncharacterized protein n=3 Tax=Candidatus Hakubella thermalkaliphila TaxID=2754717 RepID=A0A6V8P4F9_9ACTN|nr:hypothetical protein HKBW3S33_00661 [Candidatus Hakubella thermalkaliphila]GFP43496.1 hypothetical protein HKBW3C_02626 [Candidatus Hakubella thermalkaliphila]